MRIINSTLKFANLVFIVLFFAQFSTHASETAKGAQKDYENFKIEMSAKLKSVEKQIIELREKVKRSGNAAQAEAINDLEATQSELKKDLANMKETSKTNWKQIKSSFAESLDRLNAKIQRAVKD